MLPVCEIVGEAVLRGGLFCPSGNIEPSENGTGDHIPSTPNLGSWKPAGGCPPGKAPLSNEQHGLNGFVFADPLLLFELALVVPSEIAFAVSARLGGMSAAADVETSPMEPEVWAVVYGALVGVGGW